MHKRLFLLTATCLLLLTLPADARKAVMPPGSFLTAPANTPQDLAKLIRTDALVAKRFSKHFGMSAEALAEYFEKNLVISTADTTKYYTVYFISRNGRIVAHRKRLKAGTPIFVAPNNHPVLDARCGNPLSKQLPKVVEEVKPVPLPMVTAEPIPVPVASETTLLVAEPVLPPPPPPEPIVEVLATPAIELPALPSSGLSNVLPGLLGAGAIGALLSGGDGGSTVIPEPTSMLALSLGMTGLAFQICRRRRIGK